MFIATVLRKMFYLVLQVYDIAKDHFSKLMASLYF